MKAEGTYPSKVFVLLVVVSVWGGNQVCAVSESNMVSFEKLPYTFDFDGPPYPEPNLVFDGPFPKVPEKMIVYKVKDPNVTEGSMRRLAEEYFDMPVDANITRSRRMGLYRLKSGNTLVEVDRATGSFNIRRIVTESSEGMMSRDYPTKMECSNLARSYLETRKLLPESAYLRGIADNTKSSWGAVSVAFGRKIEQYNCWGAGGEILVEIGPGGGVLAMRKSWQELIPYKPFPTKTPQEALTELQTGQGVLIHGGEGKVKKISIVYYTSPQKQAYVQPIYYFECTGSERDFYGVVPAIKNEYMKTKEQTIKDKTEQKEE